jgi:hypothetical protein
MTDIYKQLQAACAGSMARIDPAEVLDELEKLRTELLKTLKRLDRNSEHYDEMPCDVCEKIAALAGKGVSHPA